MKVAFASTFLLFATVQTAAAFTGPLFGGKTLDKVKTGTTNKVGIARKTVVANKKKAPVKRIVKKPALLKSKAPAPKKKALKASPKKSPLKKQSPPKKSAPKKTSSTKPAASEKTEEKNKKSLSLPSLSVPSVDVPSPVGAAGVGMNALKPLFGLEARIQAGVAVFVTDIVGAPFRIDPKELRRDIKKKISNGKPVMYTYGLSPFSGEAKKLMEDYDVEVVELGLEWFLLGAGGSETRVILAENSENKQTSLPHLFANGESLGGLSTGGRNNEGIAGLVKSGAADKVLKRKRKVNVSKRTNLKPRGK